MYSKLYILIENRGNLLKIEPIMYKIEEYASIHLLIQQLLGVLWAAIEAVGTIES